MVLLSAKKCEFREQQKDRRKVIEIWWKSDWSDKEVFNGHMVLPTDSNCLKIYKNRHHPLYQLNRIIKVDHPTKNWKLLIAKWSEILTNCINYQNKKKKKRKNLKYSRGKLLQFPENTWDRTLEKLIEI